MRKACRSMVYRRLMARPDAPPREHADAGRLGPLTRLVACSQLALVSQIAVTNHPPAGQAPTREAAVCLLGVIRDGFGARGKSLCVRYASQWSRFKNPVGRSFERARLASSKVSMRRIGPLFGGNRVGEVRGPVHGAKSRLFAAGSWRAWHHRAFPSLAGAVHSAQTSPRASPRADRLAARDVYSSGFA
jgi:hypothetical protein